MGSRQEHGRAVQAARTKIAQGIIRTGERVGGGLDGDLGLWHDAEKIYAVPAREIGDRDDLSFFPQQVIGKARDIAHVDAGAHHAAALAHRPQGGWNERAHRRVDDRGIEGFRRQLIGPTNPIGAEALRKGFGGLVARPDKSEYLAALPFRYLSDDMGGGSKAIE